MVNIGTEENPKNILFTNMLQKIEAPLNSIIESAEKLSCCSDTEQKKIAENIISSGSIIKNTLNNISQFFINADFKASKINETYKLQNLIIDIYSIANSYIQNKPIKLILLLNPTLPETLTGDIFKLQYILSSIIKICMNVTESGSITLSVDWNGNTENAVFTFNLKDTGNLAEVSENTSFSVSRYFAELLGGNVTANNYEDGNSFTLTISQQIDEYTPVGESAAEIITENRYAPPENKFVSADNSENLININQGIIYFSGNMEEYLDILSAIYSDSFQKTDNCANVTEIHNIERYINILTSFKSIAKLIGAEKLVRIIKANEYAYSCQDYGFIRNNLPIVINVYNETMQKINSLLIENGRNVTRPEPNIPEDQYTVAGVSFLKAAYYIDNFNIIAAKNELEKLIDSDEIDWIKSEVVKRALNLISNCCYQEVKNLVVALAKGEKI